MRLVKKDEQLYVQIANDIRLRFKQTAPNTKLPLRKDLAKYYGVSLKTLNHAMLVLYPEGWLEVRRGIGTFVKMKQDRYL